MVKITKEKYVSEDEAAEALGEETTPPPMTVSRLRRLFDEGAHIHEDDEGNEVEYLHTWLPSKETVDIHEIAHVEVNGDFLKSLMDTGEFKLGKCPY